MNKYLAHALGVLLAMAASGASHAALLGVTFAGDVYLINESTAAGTLVGSSGVQRLNSLTEDGAGGFLSATSLLPPAGGGELVSINASTGEGTVGASIDLGGNVVSIRALAVSPAATLFAANNPPAGSVTVETELYTLDPVSGVAELVGQTGLEGLQALTFSPGGTLYGWSGGGLTGAIRPGLVILDPATGLASDVDPAVDDQDLNLQSITFGLDGSTLFGVTNNDLYTIDLASGAATLVGSGAYSDIRGLAAVIPLPPAVWLFGSGVLALSGLSRRKKAA